MQLLAVLTTTFHKDQRVLARAIPLVERTLASHRRVLGEDQPATLTPRNNLAYAYQDAVD